MAEDCKNKGRQVGHGKDTVDVKLEGPNHEKI